MNTINLPSALRRVDAAAKMSISPTKFDEWVSKGWMPEGIKIIGIKLWDADEIQDHWNKLRDQYREGKEEEVDDKENPYDSITF